MKFILELTIVYGPMILFGIALMLLNKSGYTLANSILMKILIIIFPLLIILWSVFVVMSGRKLIHYWVESTVSGDLVCEITCKNCNSMVAISRYQVLRKRFKCPVCKYDNKIEDQKITHLKV